MTILTQSKIQNVIPQPKSKTVSKSDAPGTQRVDIVGEVDLMIQARLQCG